MVEDLTALAVDTARTSPEQHLILAEQHDALAAVIAALPTDQRALTPRRVEGLSPEEIAIRLGVSARHVRRLIVRVLAYAQAELRGAETDEA